MSCWGWEALVGQDRKMPDQGLSLSSCHFPLAGPSGKGGGGGLY